MNFARSAQRAAMSAHIRLYELTGGAIGQSFGGLPCLLLGTTGWKSGLHRTTPLGYAKHRDEYILAASNGGGESDPFWFRNIEQNPRVTIRVGKVLSTGSARVLMPGQRHYDELFSLLNAQFGGRYYHYQLKTPRPIPLVIIAASSETDLSEGEAQSHVSAAKSSAHE
jgi:deazaflavin-dependent oxidoreductase (nitroreductase family)